MNSGDLNSGDLNSGDLNSGNRNSGNWNSGNRNSGNWNSGNWNSGNWNSGDLNSGNRNSGNWNSGNWNSGNWNSGFFNTESHRFMFDAPVTEDQINDTQWPSWLYFDLIEWIYENNMTTEQKAANPSYKTTGGFLRVLNYKDAARESYLNTTREDQLLTLKLPNFNADKFEQIFGFRVDAERPPLSGKKVEVKIDGVTYIATID